LPLIGFRQLPVVSFSLLGTRLASGCRGSMETAGLMVAGTMGIGAGGHGIVLQAVDHHFPFSFYVASRH
jgi:hypothetical protein